VFPLNELGYFAGTGGFHGVVTMGACCLAWAVLIFISCGLFLGYVLVFVRYCRNAAGFSVLFTDYFVGQ
jgi:hypothetical protein